MYAERKVDLPDDPLGHEMNTVPDSMTSEEMNIQATNPVVRKTRYSAGGTLKICV